MPDVGTESVTSPPVQNVVGLSVVTVASGDGLIITENGVEQPDVRSVYKKSAVGEEGSNACTKPVPESILAIRG